MFLWRYKKRNTVRRLRAGLPAKSEPVRPGRCAGSRSVSFVVRAAACCCCVGPLWLLRIRRCRLRWRGRLPVRLVLARSWGRRKLLAGLGCGGFYCACLLLSSLAAGGALQPGAGELSLLAAVLLGGTAGGAAAALRDPAGPRKVP